MAAPVDAMACRLAEERLHDVADQAAAAWDELANAIGCHMEGRGTMERVDSARAWVARAERIAHDELVAELRMVGGHDGRDV